MALSWNEIKDRALHFSKEWANTLNEEADAKPFLVEFFNVFGISSKRVSTFEHRVKKLDEKDGYIDLLFAVVGMAKPTNNILTFVHSWQITIS